MGIRETLAQTLEKLMEAAKNGIFIVTRPLRGGDGVRAGPLRKKRFLKL